MSVSVRVCMCDDQRQKEKKGGREGERERSDKKNAKQTENI